MAEHRVGLVQLGGAAPERGRRRRPAARATSSISSGSCGRNSCSGGSSRRIVTGRPAMIAKDSMKSSRCIGRILASAARRPSASSARIISRIATDALGVEEHVLGAAQADALGAEPARRVGHRAGYRHWRAPQPAALVGPAHQRREVARELAGSTVGTAPRITSPRLPSRVMHVPGPHLVVTRRAGASGRDRSRGRRHRRRRACPCRARPPRRGWSCRRARSGCPWRHACRGCPRARSRGAPGSPPRPAGRQALGLIGAEHDLARGRAGRRRQALARSPRAGRRDRASGAAAGRARRDRSVGSPRRDRSGLPRPCRPRS